MESQIHSATLWSILCFYRWFFGWFKVKFMVPFGWVIEPACFWISTHFSGHALCDWGSLAGFLRALFPRPHLVSFVMMKVGVSWTFQLFSDFGVDHTDLLWVSTKVRYSLEPLRELWRFNCSELLGTWNISSEMSDIIFKL